MFLRYVYTLSLLPVFIVLSSPAAAQDGDYIFRHLTREDGLAATSVNYTCQDSHGFIWIATQNGLQRYDGYRCVTYRSDPHNASALQSDWITTIFEDSRHRMWIGTNEGPPYLLDPATGRFSGCKMASGHQSASLAGVRSFLEDFNGDIWANAQNGIFKLNARTNCFESYNQPLGIAGPGLGSTLAIDRQGSIWFVTQGSLECYVPGKKIVYNRRNNPGGLRIFGVDDPVNIQFDDCGNAWIDTHSSEFIYRYSFPENSTRLYPLDHQAGRKPPALRRKKVFDFINIIGTDARKYPILTLPLKGIALYDPAQDTFAVIHIHNEDPYGLHAGDQPFSFVYAHAFTDRQSNVWIGTDQGINIFNTARRPFHTYLFKDLYPHPSSRSPHPSCASGFLRTRHDGDIYISYYEEGGGILRLDSNLKYKHYYLFHPEHRAFTFPNQLWCLFQDEKGMICAPAQDKSVLRLDPSNGRLTRQGPSPHANINTICRDQTGDTWLGSWQRGLIQMERTTHSFRSYNIPPPRLTTPVKNVFSICPDDEGILWTGTCRQGLLRFDKNKYQFTDAYTFDEKDSCSISSNIVSDILSYNKDTLLIATGAGINIFDKTKKKFSVITTKDGLPDNFVQSIALDKSRRVWAACLNGICRIDLSARLVSRYDAADGVRDPTFQSRPFFALADGRFLVAEAKGFMVFNPDSLEENDPALNVTITGFRVFDRMKDVGPFIGSSQPFRLPYEDNSITIEFSALSFTSPGRIRYFYQLEGVDKDWLPADKEQAVHYHRLPPGHYLFKVKCTGRNNQPSHEITTLPLYIVPAVWNTWWFYTILLLLSASALLFAGKLSHDRKKKKELLQLQYDKKIAVGERNILRAQLNALRAQMNPHFIFNSLNSINNFILNNEPANARSHLQKFSQLVRLILDNSRTEWISLENELKTLKLYIELEALRLNNSFEYFITVAPDVIINQIQVPPLIIQPYVENAIWHGLRHRETAGGQISIHIRRTDDELMISIEDNGIGRAASEKLKSSIKRLHTSHGMEITAERLAFVNEVYKVNASVTVVDLPDDTTPTPGTRILLTIQYRTYACIDH